MLSMVGKKRTHFNVGMAVVLQVKNEADQELVKSLKPRIIHYFLEELYDVMGNEVGNGKDVAMSLPRVQKKLMAVSDKIIGEGIVEDVLIQLMSKRPA